MDNSLRATLRGFAALGATLAFIATFLAWYTFQVVLGAGGVLHAFVVPITLWDLTTLAPIIITVAAVVALLCVAAWDSRAAGAVTALVGLGVAVYGIVRCFDVPSLGVLSGVPAGASATTTLNGGPLLEIVAGIMLLVGSLADLLPGREEEAPGAVAREEGARFGREGSPAARRARTGGT